MFTINEKSSKNNGASHQARCFLASLVAEFDNFWHPRLAEFDVFWHLWWSMFLASLVAEFDVFLASMVVHFLASLVAELDVMFFGHHWWPSLMFIWASLVTEFDLMFLGIIGG